MKLIVGDSLARACRAAGNSQIVRCIRIRKLWHVQVKT